MGTMHVEGGKTHWVSCRPKICSSKRASTCAGNRNCKGWHNPGVGNIPCTDEHRGGPPCMHSRMGLPRNGHNLSLCVHGLIIQGLCQGLCWCCTSLEQCLHFCGWSPMVFSPEREMKLQERSWLLCCAEILGKLGFPLAAAAWAAALFAHMWHFGQPCCFLEAGEVSPWKQ